MNLIQQNYRSTIPQHSICALSHDINLSPPCPLSYDKNVPYPMTKYVPNAITLQGNLLLSGI